MIEVYADIKQKVIIEPIDVLAKLIEREIGDGWIIEEDGKYYVGYYLSAGVHSLETRNEISKETYDFVMSLKNAIKFLRKNE